MGKYVLILAPLLLIVALAARSAVQRGNEHHRAAHLCVLSQNIGDVEGLKPDFDTVCETLLTEGAPDVLLLQELYTPRCAERIRDRTGLPHIAHKGDLAIFSRRPLENVRALELGPGGKGRIALAAETSIAGHRWLLCTVHLHNIDDEKRVDHCVRLDCRHTLDVLKQEMLGDSVRAQSVRALLDWLEADHYDRVVVGGDFNTFPFSKAVRSMERSFDDALWPSLDYFCGTYKRIHFPIKPRIDFIFHSPELSCPEAGVIRRTAGDHYPVYARFGLGG